MNFGWLAVTMNEKCCLWGHEGKSSLSDESDKIGSLKFRHNACKDVVDN